MQSLLNFLVSYQNWIYLLLALIGGIYLKKLISAIIEWRSTIFGLEREYAQQRLNTSLVMVILVILLVIAEFVCVTFIITELPQSIPVNDDALVAAPSNNESDALMGVIPSVGQESSGCIPEQIMWIEPHPGIVISGVFTLIATVNIPNMGFYQYDYAPLEDQEHWHAISAGNTPVVEGKLGVLATTEIPNGDYILRMTVFNKNNNQLPPCDVAVRIMNKDE